MTQQHRTDGPVATRPQRKHRGPCEWLARGMATAAVTLLVSFSGDTDAPFSPSAGVPGGATIQGLVNPSGTRSARAVSVHTAITRDDSLMVTVVGTNLTSEVGDDGQFLIADVPPGHIQLRFSAATIDALLDMTVEPYETLTIIVRVAGNTAALESRSSDNSTDSDEMDDDSEDDNSEDRSKNDDGDESDDDNDGDADHDESDDDNDDDADHDESDDDDADDDHSDEDDDHDHDSDDHGSDDHNSDDDSEDDD